MCELVGFVVRRGSLGRLHPVQNGGDSGTTVFLEHISNVLKFAFSRGYAHAQLCITIQTAIKLTKKIQGLSL